MVAATTDTTTSGAERLQRVRAQLATTQQLIAGNEARSAAATAAIKALEAQRVAAHDKASRAKQAHRDTQALVRRATVEVSLAAGTPGEEGAAEAHAAAVKAAEQAHADVQTTAAAASDVAVRTDRESQEHREALTVTAAEKSDLEDQLQHLRAIEREALFAATAERSAELVTAFNEAREQAREAFQRMLDTGHQLRRLPVAMHIDFHECLKFPGWHEASGAADQIDLKLMRSAALLEGIFTEPVKRPVA